MGLRMVTMQPDPNYIDGESKNFFNIPIMNPTNSGPICTNGITCYPISVFYSVTEVPFIAINNFFHIITDDTLVLTQDDFYHPHYVFWRNSENKDFVFMELTYGPFFIALSASVFYLICLEHKFSRKTSLVLSFLLALSTILWAYSHTSLNLAPTLLFILSGYLFYKKFQNTSKFQFLIFSGALLGFAFLIREDSILFIIPLWIFIVINTIKKKTKISSVLVFSAPLVLSYIIWRITPFFRYKISENDPNGPIGSEISTFLRFSSIDHIVTAIVGTLFSPGVGLFVFSPILLTVFFSFPDFFKKNKSECLLFLSFFGLTLLYHANLPFWHGLTGWGPRYMLTIIPFLLIPLGTSLETRNKKFMLCLIIALGVVGAFFNIPYLVQDVPWFVWGSPGERSGLYGLGTVTTPLYIHPNVIWTFQYSQLTQSISLMFTGLQQDIYLLHVLGVYTYFGILFPSLIIMFSLLSKMTNHNKESYVKDEP